MNFLFKDGEDFQRLGVHTALYADEHGIMHKEVLLKSPQERRMFKAENRWVLFDCQLCRVTTDGFAVYELLEVVPLFLESTYTGITRATVPFWRNHAPTSGSRPLTIAMMGQLIR